MSDSQPEVGHSLYVNGQNKVSSCVTLMRIGQYTRVRFSKYFKVYLHVCFWFRTILRLQKSNKRNLKTVQLLKRKRFESDAVFSDT